MRKEILALLAEYSPTDVNCFVTNGTINWDMNIVVNGRKTTVCYGYYVGDPNGRDSLRNDIKKDIENQFKTK